MWRRGSRAPCGGCAWSIHFLEISPRKAARGAICHAAGDERVNPVCYLKWMGPVVLSTKALIDRYYRPEHLAPYCEQCENYGRNHACPPTGIDMLALLRSYDRVRLYAARLMMPPTLARSEVSAFFARGMVDFSRNLWNARRSSRGASPSRPGSAWHARDARGRTGFPASVLTSCAFRWTLFCSRLRRCPKNCLEPKFSGTTTSRRRT